MSSTDSAGGNNFLHSLKVCTPLIRASDPYQSSASTAHTSVDAQRPEIKNPTNNKALRDRQLGIVITFISLVISNTINSSGKSYL